MNRRRNEESRSPFYPLLALILAAVVATTGGAMHAIYRTAQIKTERKIRQVKQRIEQHHFDMQLIDVRREKLLDRYEIRDRLEHLDSALVPVTHGVVEKVGPEPQGEPVAARS